jgi:hypothetical protein
MLILLLVLLLVFGVGGYSLGGSERGYHYGGGGIGLVLIIALVLYLMGVIRL